MKFLGYITDSMPVCYTPIRLSVLWYCLNFFHVGWCTVYLKICQLCYATGLHQMDTIAYGKSVEDVDHFVCVVCILRIYVSNGSKYCKSHLVCILAQNIYAFYRSRFLGRFEIRNLVTRLCLNRDLCDLNTST